MICSKCGSPTIIWEGVPGDLSHTKCYDCGGLNCLWEGNAVEPAPDHPLTIPGELLDEACEIGDPGIQRFESGKWFAWFAGLGHGSGKADTPAEALQAAIDNAREAGK